MHGLLTKNAVASSFLNTDISCYIFLRIHHNVLQNSSFDTGAALKAIPGKNIMAYFFALKTTYDSFDRFIKFV
ncbi:hypothetical protein [Lactiplantibacillus plantarum]|uniref:hypothetical protein n=1 Tax=Lactiplantibacillus plantarum TaxID=1590 RepID=UPI00214B8395|nr:hypothetical protein [Lactiplantibacillus plantarum]